MHYEPIRYLPPKNIVGHNAVSFNRADETLSTFIHAYIIRRQKRFDSILMKFTKIKHTIQ